ncbi:hypothetical protein QBC35DRAFT_479219 [Podospora australis]|uniref:Ankyrin n=1 Tax=Podospora australis TaxID=1536484 RepID=A0AAN7ADR4_9PEZI|nr:hypothetical protein QBC35DRAFT_479219 [Podospora australis]
MIRLGFTDEALLLTRILSTPLAVSIQAFLGRFEEGYYPVCQMSDSTDNPVGTYAACIWSGARTLLDLVSNNLTVERILSMPIRCTYIWPDLSLGEPLEEPIPLLLNHPRLWILFEGGMYPTLECLVGRDTMLLAATRMHSHFEITMLGGRNGEPEQISSDDCMGGDHLFNCRVKEAISRGAEVNSAPCRITPLQAAVQCWDYHVAEFLIENGAEVNMVGDP